MGWFVLRAGPAAAPLQLSFRPAGGAIIGRQKGVIFESKLTLGRRPANMNPAPKTVQRHRLF